MINAPVPLYSLNPKNAYPGGPTTYPFLIDISDWETVIVRGSFTNAPSSPAPFPTAGDVLRFFQGDTLFANTFPAGRLPSLIDSSGTQGTSYGLYTVGPFPTLPAGVWYYNFAFAMPVVGRYMQSIQETFLAKANGPTNQGGGGIPIYLTINGSNQRIPYPIPLATYNTLNIANQTGRLLHRATAFNITGPGTTDIPIMNHWSGRVQVTVAVTTGALNPVYLNHIGLTTGWSTGFGGASSAFSQIIEVGDLLDLSLQANGAGAGPVQVTVTGCY